MRDHPAAVSLLLAASPRVLVLGAFLAIQGWAAQAEACSCSDQGVWAGIDWPKDGATDVPNDTALAVSMYFDDESSVTPVLTRMADGVEIPLKRERTFLTSICVTASEILRPTKPLDPGQTYSLGFRYETPDPEVILEPIPSYTFTTGLADTTQAPEPEVAVSYRRLLAPPNCEPMPHLPCEDYAEVHVAATYPFVGDTPLWVVVSQGARKAAAQLTSTSEPLQTFTLGVPVVPGEPCVNVEAFDGYGRTLRRETLCEPEKCAILADGRLGGGSCTTGHDALGEAVWTQVADGTCDSPPELSIDREGGVPVFTLTQPKKPESGCNLSVRQRSHAAWSMLLVSSAVLALRRRRA